ncbi:Hypothetical predicted protein [Marmota monax]|uniref:Uncharacterized protein n=1 Tax=Marmota monax TaxID=9995 RepID=A0A5E4B8A3_MARMO|nr:hypothetical protein GHT09_005773 [Marmota monax]VTJ64942.1 Hypothetical predicted protein [Marmota monax]
MGEPRTGVPGEGGSLGRDRSQGAEWHEHASSVTRTGPGPGLLQAALLKTEAHSWQGLPLPLWTLERRTPTCSTQQEGVMGHPQSCRALEPAVGQLSHLDGHLPGPGSLARWAQESQEKLPGHPI